MIIFDVNNGYSYTFDLFSPVTMSKLDAKSIVRKYNKACKNDNKERQESLIFSLLVQSYVCTTFHGKSQDSQERENILSIVSRRAFKKIYSWVLKNPYVDTKCLKSHAEIFLACIQQDEVTKVDLS